MKTISLKLKKNDLLTLGDHQYQVTKNTTIKAKKIALPPTSIEGEHRSDTDDFIHRKAVINIINGNLKKLEQQEYNAMFDISADDPLFLFDDEVSIPKNSLDEQVSRVDQMNLLKEQPFSVCKKKYIIPKEEC